MKPFRKNPDLIRRYQEILLDKEWNADVMNETLGLISEFVGPSLGEVISVPEILGSEPGTDLSAMVRHSDILSLHPLRYDSFIHTKLSYPHRYWLFFYPLFILENWPVRTDGKLYQLSAQAFLITSSLTLFSYDCSLSEDEEFVRKYGHTDFLLDLQSLLFLESGHYLIPRLQEIGMDIEHDRLVSAMFDHASQAWQGNPSHQHYLLYALYDAIGKDPQAHKHLEFSLMLTHPDNHEYLTKVQDYWSVLTDKKEWEKAEQFLFDTARRCNREDLEELKEIMALHFEMKIRKGDNLQ